MTVVRAIAPRDAHIDLPVVPPCPIPGCNTILTEDEILRIIDRGYDEGMHDVDDFPSLLQGKTREQHKAVARALIFKRTMVLEGYKRCPTCRADDGGDFWFEDQFGVPRIVCPNPTCGIEFCGNCNLSPYHYHCSCAEVVQYTRAWNDWCESGRDAHVTAMNAQDEDFAARKADYDKAQQGQVSLRSIRFASFI
jgi:hypothetical protein